MEVDQMSSEDSSKKSANAKKTTEDPPSPSSSETTPVTQTTSLNLNLDETGTFRICTRPSCAKQTTEVLKKLNDREREMWCRRFTKSCIENILNSATVDEETKAFYREVERKLKEQ
jgi:hypothetical protein